MNNIDQWVFHLTKAGQWKAAKREDYRELFNNNTSDKVLRSSSVDTLVELITRTNGDITEINKLIQK